MWYAFSVSYYRRSQTPAISSYLLRSWRVPLRFSSTLSRTTMIFQTVYCEQLTRKFKEPYGCIIWFISALHENDKKTSLFGQLFIHHTRKHTGPPRKTWRSISPNRRIGPLHDPVTWYEINYAGTQITQWDFQNKGTRSSPAQRSFVLKVLLLTRFSRNAFEAVQKTRNTCFTGSKTTRLRLVVLNPKNTPARFLTLLKVPFCSTILKYLTK